MRKKKKVTDSEEIILKLLWKVKEPLSIAQITNCLQEQGVHWAYNTVATFLRNMYKKETVKLTKKGVFYYYEAAVTKEEVTNGAITFVNKYFQGSLKNFLLNFSSERGLTEQEIKDLKEWVEQLNDNHK